MTNNRVPDLILEQFLLNELPEEQMRAIALAIDADPELQHRVRLIEESNTEILEHYLPERMISLIATRVEKNGKKQVKGTSVRTGVKLKKIIPSFALATLFVSASVYFSTRYLYRQQEQWPSNVEITREKGLDQGLYIYRKKGETVEKLTSGDRAGAGDLLQIAYYVRSNDYGVIFSLDGRGDITLQYPGWVGMSTRLLTGKRSFLESSYELDSAPGYEKFILITSPVEIAVDRILDYAPVIARDQKAGLARALSECAECEVYEFTLLKR